MPGKIGLINTVKRCFRGKNINNIPKKFELTEQQLKLAANDGNIKFYGGTTLEEAQNVAKHLDVLESNGVVINKSAIKKALNEEHPGGSGGSSYAIITALKNFSDRGKSIEKAMKSNWISKVKEKIDDVIFDGFWSLHQK